MPIRQRWQHIWGEATALLDRSRRVRWVDLLIVVSLAGVLYGVVVLAGQMTQRPQEEIVLDTSWWALPRYTFFSLCRGLIAFVLSLLFTLSYGYWAAKDPLARRVLIPLLDILQSIPVLGFMPALLLVFVNLFPNSNIGLELAAIVSIFTGQAWNMTFSFYQSVRSVPQDMHEAATVYRFTWWERFKWVELPYSAMGLVWNSMMSMAGGWFFLATIEGLEIGGHRYWSPGIGSYIKQAISGDQWDWSALVAGVIAMGLMIVLLDQLVWRPVVAWAQKFRVEEGGASEQTTSWFLDWMRRSRLLNWAVNRVQALRLSRKTGMAKTAPERHDPTRPWRGAAIVSNVLFALLVTLLAWGLYQLALLIRNIQWEDWGRLLYMAACTLGRVLAAVTIGTLWALPAGLAIGLSPRLSRILQPVVQVLASFPAPLLFPMVVFLMEVVGLSLNWGSILLMLLGTQWYILFNIIAGAMAVPADLREAARSYRLGRWQRFKVLYLPAIFPYLVTGWVTAAGGAWNASIVAEYIEPPKPPLKAIGLGAQIMEAAGTTPADYPMLAASVMVMSMVVVMFNRMIWRRMYRLAEERYSLNK
jgi:NitT/TauT family transport system permease protein